MNLLISALVGVVAFVGGLFSHLAPTTYDAGGHPAQTFGTTNYPASLDSTTNLPNPGATDSVATVSHSALHTNENLGIIATETKLGTGASTATNNTVLIGNGVGTSAWSATPSLTSLTTTGLGTFGNLLSLGSSTLQNFTALNSTTTNATSTSLFTSSASSTSFFGAGLSSCVGSNVLQWTAGAFSCTTPVAANGATYYIASSTSVTDRYMAQKITIPIGSAVFLSAYQLSNTGSVSPGDLRYRIVSPWLMASTTILTGSGWNNKVYSVTNFPIAATSSSLDVWVEWTAGENSVLIKTLMAVLNNFTWSNNF